MSGGRGRLVFAGVATALLIAAVVAVAVSGSADEDAPADECLAVWNDDAVGRSDGVHAYTAHGYRAVLVGRVDPEGELIGEAVVEGEPSPEQRCAVIFAAPRVDSEPDFGVRVHDDGRWAGLAVLDRVPLDRIEALQRDATATADATLLPDGRLSD